MRRLVVLFVVVMPLAFAACGEDLSLEGAVKRAHEKQQAAARELQAQHAQAAQTRLRERAQLEEAIARAKRQRRRAAARAAELAQEREQARAAKLAAAQQSSATQSCHASYDPCLDPNASDYDCTGGSGDGPEYTGPVTVKGPDDYDLDADGDGSACEPY